VGTMVRRRGGRFAVAGDWELDWDEPVSWLGWDVPRFPSLYSRSEQRMYVGVRNIVTCWVTSRWGYHKVPSRSVLVLRTVARHGPIEVYHTQETFGAAQFMRRSEWYERVDEDAGEAE